MADKSDKADKADKAAAFLQMIRRDRRGRLKIYLGYAAGVGKTYLMLQEGHRLLAEGMDVVIGVIETHGRQDTARLLEGLAKIPMKVSEYRSIKVEEMDLEAILARRPQVVLVDELAHTNAPGSRNPKRYQDVEDILAAGIHVISTLNVQHLESLFDTVEKATRVKVRERLPDAVLAEADQIINVDVSPEDLQKRLRAGKIYPMDRVDTALENFFQSTHLEQLRELTLRETASQIDYRRRETAGEAGAGATDQVMVCLDSRGPENAALLRYASRLAGRLNRNWYAVYVQTLDEEPTVIDATRQRLLADTMTLANQLGATVFTLKGNDVAEALSRFAREYRVGHMLVGRPHPRPWWMRLASRGTVVDRLLHKGGGFTLTLIDTRAGQGPASLEEPVPEDAVRAKKPGDRLKLTDFLGPEQILIWNGPVSKEQAMRDLIQAIGPARSGMDPDHLLKKLHERESEGSTFLNEGIALPHARIENLEKPLVGLGLCHAGILDAFTENPIEVVFLLLSPKDEHRSHLQLLAIAGRMMLNRTLRGDLRKEMSVEGVYRRLLEFENPG